VASGASESEIFIWDLNSPDKPMTPGAKAQVGTVTQHLVFIGRAVYSVSFVVTVIVFITATSSVPQISGDLHRLVSANM